VDLPIEAEPCLQERGIRKEGFRLRLRKTYLTLRQWFSKGQWHLPHSGACVPIPDQLNEKLEVLNSS
jgi:hypothetical protein